MLIMVSDTDLDKDFDDIASSGVSIEEEGLEHDRGHESDMYSTASRRAATMEAML